MFAVPARAMDRLLREENLLSRSLTTMVLAALCVISPVVAEEKLTDTQKYCIKSVEDARVEDLKKCNANKGKKKRKCREVVAETFKGAREWCLSEQVQPSGKETDEPAIEEAEPVPGDKSGY